MLLPHFEEPEYINDFAGWVRHSLHDAKLADNWPSLSDSVQRFGRFALPFAGYIDDRLEESEYLQWSQALQRFQFIRSQIVVFDARISVADPREMVDLIPRLSVNSVFYHFIDSRRRTENNIDDFRQWLSNFGDTYQPLIEQLARIDPYFVTLTQLRQQLAATFEHYFAETVP